MSCVRGLIRRNIVKLCCHAAALAPWPVPSEEEEQRLPGRVCVAFRWSELAELGAFWHGAARRQRHRCGALDRAAGV